MPEVFAFRIDANEIPAQRKEEKKLQKCFCMQLYFSDSFFESPNFVRAGILE